MELSEAYIIRVDEGARAENFTPPGKKVRYREQEKSRLEDT